MREILARTFRGLLVVFNDISPGPEDVSVTAVKPTHTLISFSRRDVDGFVVKCVDSISEKML